MPTILQWPGNAEREIPALPQWVDNLSLAAATAETYTVPATVAYLMVSAGASVYARIGGTAVVPSADLTDGTGSFGLGTESVISVTAGQQISIICATATQVQLGCFSSRY